MSDDYSRGFEDVLDLVLYEIENCKTIEELKRRLKGEWSAVKERKVLEIKKRLLTP